MNLRCTSLILIPAALALTGCGGETTTSSRLWTLTEFANGTPSSVTSTAVAVYRNAGNTVVAFPNGGTRTYPTDAPDSIIANNGDLIDPTSTGFVLYDAENPEGLTVAFPTEGTPYGAPQAADSQGRVYGPRNGFGTGNQALWIYADGEFATYDLPAPGQVQIVGIDDQDRLLLRRGLDAYDRFTYPSTHQALGTFNLTNLQVRGVDSYGNLVGSNNLGGPTNGTAVVWTGSNAYFYEGFNGSLSAVAYGQIGNVVVGTSTDNSGATPVVWSSEAPEPLFDNVNFGLNMPLEIIAVTRNRVYITYQSAPFGSTKTGYLTPPQ